MKALLYKLGLVTKNDYLVVKTSLKNVYADLDARNADMANMDNELIGCRKEISTLRADNEKLFAGEKPGVTKIALKEVKPNKTSKKKATKKTPTKESK